MKNIKDVFQKGNFDRKGEDSISHYSHWCHHPLLLYQFYFFHDTKYLKFIHSFTYATISPHQNVDANILKLGPCVSFPLLPAKHLELMPGM